VPLEEEEVMAAEAPKPASHAFRQAVGIVGCALALALVSNLVGPGERRLAWVSDYPNALTVPGSTESTPPKTPLEKPAAVPARPPAAVVSDVPAAAPPAAARPAGKPPAAVRPASPKTDSPSPSTASASPSVAPAPDVAAESFPPHPDRPWVEISPEQAKRLFEQKVLFLDARRTSVYREGHVPGARSFAVWEADVDDKVKSLAGENLPAGVPVVVYCSGGDCEDSHMLAQKLWGVGLDNVLVYKDGFPDWEKRGWPVVRSGQK
jgi:rhodanese-related sulfurtransferase